MGTYFIVVTYSGGTDYFGSNNGTQTPAPTLTINSASTSISANNATAIFGSVNQNVTLSATVTAAGSTGPVNEGTVTFKVFLGATQIGASTTSGTVSGGNAFATFVLPGNRAVGTYTIVATYNGGTDFSGSTNSTQTPAPTLIVSKASTSIAVNNSTAFFGNANQNVTLSAVVSATTGAGLVNAGTVTFTVFQGAMQIGTPVTLGTVSGGNASATYVLPAGTVVGSYTIVATYNPGTNYTGSDNATQSPVPTLTVSQASTSITASNATVLFSSTDQNVTLSAVVSPTTGAGSVNEGRVTFEVFQGVTQIGVSTTSGTVVGGNASVTFVVPGNTAVGSYTIVTIYNPGSDYAGSTNSTQSPAPTLIVNQYATSTSVAPVASVVFETSTQTVTLTANVTDHRCPWVNEADAFRVFQGTTQIGVAQVGDVDSVGNATVTYTLPASTRAGTYTIRPFTTMPPSNSATAPTTPRR